MMASGANVVNDAVRDVRLAATAGDRIAWACLCTVALLLLAFLAAPLAAILLQAVQDSEGRFLGLANFISYAQTPALLTSLWNSLWVSAAVTIISVPAAFVFAYALTRSGMRGKALFRGITLIPLLAPSLLSAISLIYWFGNQGALKSTLTALGISEIYGAPGIVVAEIFAVFPHALMILVTALTAADARLYEAAAAMGTRAWTGASPVNAAESAKVASTHIPIASTSSKPRLIDTGGTSLRNGEKAAENACRTSPSVSPVGRPHANEERR